MKTFNKVKKQKYIDRAVLHRKADEIVQGLYYEDGKGCCVGCLAHANENAHEELEKQTGIPEWLSRLADTLHEGLPDGEYQKWPELFVSSVPKNTTHDDFLYKVKAPFTVFVLKSNLEDFDHDRHPDVLNAVNGSIELWERDDIYSTSWNAARSAAWSATRIAADSAARRSAADSAAESAARSAAESAARRSAAWSVAWSAALSAAESAAYIKLRDELVRLLKDMS